MAPGGMRSVLVALEQGSGRSRLRRTRQTKTSAHKPIPGEVGQVAEVQPSAVNRVVFRRRTTGTASTLTQNLKTAT